jgi:nucleoside-diphosphate-sugar epimerase
MQRPPHAAVRSPLARLGPVRIFVAGASGVIGIRLVPLLIADGHVVAGLTRSPAKASHLRELGAEPVVCDVFDASGLAAAVAAFAPDLVVHQLTDLPDSVTDLAAFGDRNDRIRTEGTRNLLAAANAAGAQRVIAQSISWEQPKPARRAATAEFERCVLQAGGVVVRYGQLFGPGTYYEGTPPDPPRIHVDDAARRTVPALTAPAGLTIVVDDRSTGPETAF